MNKKMIFPALGFLLILGSVLHSLDPRTVNAASLEGAKTLVLYDAASGAIPSAPLMGFTDFPPGAALPTYLNGVTVIDSSAAGSDTYAGWVSSGATTQGFPVLDRTTGFQVNFSILVESESHGTNHRAGFSVIVLGADARGIEIAFWEDEVWAQSDDTTGGLFRHGEGAALVTATGITDYQLTIVGDTYTLTANAQPVLSGLVRDYSAFDGFPDPYETPNFLFLGDNTASAQARVQIRFVSVTGAGPVTPTSTSAVVSTDTAVPTASSTPIPSVTASASPTQAGKAAPFCSSGWIFLAGIIAAGMIKKFRAG